MANTRTDLMQGTLELLILKTLSHDTMHGYGIAQRIHSEADDLLKIEDGSLYPALYRMEERGWVSPNGESPKTTAAQSFTSSPEAAGKNWTTSPQIGIQSGSYYSHPADCLRESYERLAIQVTQFELD